MKLFKKDVIIPAFILLFATLFWLFYLKTEPVFLSNPDSAKFASVARNILEKKEITINYGLNSEKMISPGVFPFTSPPLYPLILTLIFKLFGQSDKVIISTSGFFFILSALMVYFLGKKLFGRSIGVLSSIVFILNSEFIINTQSGNADSLFTFIFLLIIYLLFFNNQISIISTGILACFLITTKIQGVFYFPFFVILLLKLTSKAKFIKSIILFTIVFLAFYIFLYSKKIPIPPPRNFSTHNIYYLLSYNSSLYPGGSIDQVDINRTFSASLVIKNLFIKIITNFYTMIKNVPYITSPFILTTFLLSFIRKEEKRANSLKNLSLFLFLFLLFFSALTVFNIRYVYPLLPVIIIFSIAFFYELIIKFSKSKKSFIASLGIFFVLFFIVFQLTQINLGARLTHKGRNFGKQNLYESIGKNFTLLTNKNSVVATNVEIWGTWYGRRSTILIPLKPSELREVDYILLSSFSPGTEISQEWQSLFDKPSKFLNYTFVERIQLTASENYQNIPVSLVLYKHL